MSNQTQQATAGQLQLITRLYLTRDVCDLPPALQGALHTLVVDTQGIPLRLSYATAQDLIDRLKTLPVFTL